MPPLPCPVASDYLQQQLPPPLLESAEHRLLRQIINEQLLDVAFQPILGLASRNHLGYEALIRPRHTEVFPGPTELFAMAERCGLSTPLDHACREVILRRFAELGLPGTLFLNATPNSLFDHRFQNGETQGLLRSLDLPASRIVIEITENQKINDFGAFREVLGIFRNKGFRFAIDDLGQGMSNLRMWTEIHPEIVKIDRHFIDGIAEDALKFQLVRAMHGMAETCGAFLIAEGVERQEDFLAVRDIGIPFVQGYFVARPCPIPEKQPQRSVLEVLSGSRISVFPSSTKAVGNSVTARALVQEVQAVAPTLNCEHVFHLFEEQPELRELAVVAEDGVPIGLIHRNKLIDDLARPFRRELYGRRPCSGLMDRAILMIDESMPIQDLARQLTRATRSVLHEGFIVTEQGRYLGIGYSQDMVALITDMQIRAARYANPLTQLPGNVPINEHIERLLANQTRFVACYADLDAFKPFNDVYGYRRGDDLIQLVGDLLVEAADPREDFVGHIGGDDFLVLFQSKDWQSRCERILALFERRVRPLLSEEDLSRGSIVCENRSGQLIQHSLPALSIGALQVEPGSFGSHHEISAAAAEAKKQAKRIQGNSLFVERRRAAYPITLDAGSAAPPTTAAPCR